MANPRGNPNIRQIGAKTRFGPGNRANPGGRPKGRSITAILRRMGDEPVFPESPKTRAEMVADMLYSLAMKGDLGAIREVLDRTEGKAVARTETGEAGAFEELESKTTEELRQMLEALK